MKYIGMTALAAGLALTGAYFYGTQSVQLAQAGSSSCTYSVESVTGPKKMHAYQTMRLSTGSPSGEAMRGFTHALSVDITALDEGCEAVTFEKMVAVMTASDVANSGWYRKAAMDGLLVMNHDTGEVVANGEVERILDQEVRFRVHGENMIIPSGATVTYDFYVDTTYASDEFGDSIRLDLKENSIAWNDSVRTVRELNSEITGNTVSF